MQNKSIPTPELNEKRVSCLDRDRGLAQIKLLSQLMDSAVEIPGLRTRIGLDAVLGLVPGIGVNRWYRRSGSRVCINLCIRVNTAIPEPGASDLTDGDA